MKNSTLVVTTIGTCRVADPIHAATKLRPLHRANKRLYGFVHTAREILQQLDTLDGRVMPDQLRPYIAQAEKVSRDVSASADLFLVEVSTAKEFRFRDWFLQINHLDRALQDFLPLYQIFRAHGAEPAREIRGNLLRAHPLFAHASPFQRDILLETTVRSTTREELLDDLAEIARRLPAPAIFSTHIDVDAMDGAPLTARRKFCGWMREALTALNLPFVEPTKHVLEYGRTRALAKDGHDLNHYSEEFKAHYGCLVFDRYLAPFAAAARANVPPPSEPSSQTYEVMMARDVKPAADMTIRANLAKEHLAASRTEDAGNVAAEIVSAAPQDAFALTTAAKVLSKAKRHVDAMAAWRLVAQMQPDRPAALVEAARSGLKSKDFTKALEFIDAALVLAPDDVGATFLKVQLLAKIGSMTEMSHILIQAAATHPRETMEHVPALLSAGLAPAAAAVVAQARDAGIKEALDPALTARIVGTLTTTACESEESGDVLAAVEAWRAVRLIQPGSKGARLGLRKALAPRVAEARSLAAMEDLSGACGAYRNALALDPDDVRAWREYAGVLERTEEWSSATAAWERLADMGGSGPDGMTEALSRGARAARKAGQDGVALGFYRRLSDEQRTEHAANITSTVRRVAGAMRKDFDAGDFDAALAKIRIVLLSDPDNKAAIKLRAKVISTLARQIRSTRDDKAAQETLGRRIIAIDPNHLDALRALGRVYHNAHRHAEAAEVFERITAAVPSDPDHWVKLALAFRGSRRPDQARTALLRALEAEPGHPRARELLERLAVPEPVL